LAFVDADCTVDPDWLIHALGHFGDPRVGAVGSYCAIPLDSPTWVRRVLHLQIKGLPECVSSQWLPAANFIVRRDVFWASGGFDETLTTCEDVDLCVRISRAYILIADKRIRCLHNGEPRTLRELFYKELWRGRDNFLGVLRHGISLREMPSVLLPLYFVAVLVVLMASPALGSLSGWGMAAVMGGSLVAALLPLLGVAGAICARGKEVRQFPAVVLVAACYLLARGLAPMRLWRHA
jgi:hypothetical protein